MALYDANKDGKIDAKELEASPALADGLPRIDSNRDKAIDAAELQARFEKHDGMSDVVGVDVAIKWKGWPVEEATVTFTPEPFMGEGKQSYVGASNASGGVPLKGQEVEMIGLPTGFYTVHIVKEKSQVDEKRGVEVADDTPSPNRLQFDLHAKKPRPGR